LALLAALCVFAVVAPSSALAATGSISGTVTDASSHLGIEQVEVCAWSLPEENDWGCTAPAADGSYAIEGLEPGEYEVEFWPWGSSNAYLPQYYDGKSHWSEADPVPVGSGASVPGIDAEMVEGGKIEGTVTEAVGGAPVEEVLVCAYEVNFAAERCGWTGFDGGYAISGLPTGEYKVEFWTFETGLNLASEMYDHKYSWEEADIVLVTAGSSATEIDAALAPGAEINGEVRAASSGVPLAQIRVCSFWAASDFKWSCTWTNSSGHYRFFRLPPKAYKVGFSLEHGLYEEGEPENDGYFDQYWNQKTSLATADLLNLGTGASVLGIDAHLLSPGGSPVVVPPSASPVAKPPVKRSKRCKHGFRKKKVHGKKRCVPIRKHRKHRHKTRQGHRAGGMAARAVSPPSVEAFRPFSR
jgi:hypothetical protein